MIKSMTGYGKSVAQLQMGSKVTIEIRTLNSKQLDVSMRIPQLFREKELEIRQELARFLERGKVDFTITMETDSGTDTFSINTAVAQKYHQEILKLATEIGEGLGTNYIHTLLRMPDVLKSEQQQFNDSDWELVKVALHDALRQTNRFREEEGELTRADMELHINLVLNLLNQVKPFEEQRIKTLRERFERNLQTFLENNSKKEHFDENRFEQEIFWYLEKLDISEEKLRLQKHCDFFLQTLRSDISEGRKLGFISQEIGREINTLGSKASDVDIQKMVVLMKDELEKVKEQLGNIL